MDNVIIESESHTINPIITEAVQGENCIEVIGGIKDEPDFFIPEVESVEITADDILSSSEDDSNDNGQKPKEEINIDKIDNIQMLEANSEDDEGSIGPHGNIDYDDKFYMEANLGEGESLVLNDPHTGQPSCSKKTDPSTTRKTNPSTTCKTNETAESESVKKKRKRSVRMRQPYRVKETEYKVTETGKLQCLYCEFSFIGQYRKHQISQHILTKHREVKQLFQCPHCPYKSPWHIGSHIFFKHTSDKDIDWLKCDKCDRKYKTKNLLKRHLMTHYSDADMLALDILEQHKCTICEKSFKFRDRLKTHIRRVHEREKLKYPCDYCDFVTHASNLLEHHIEVTHTDSKNLKTHRCQKCNNYETKFIYRLKAHISVNHSKELICEICGHKTKTAPAMKLHQITHQEKIDEKELKYQCRKCDYKTYRQYSFQVHKLNHLKPSQIKYFYCYHCDFKAKRKDNLKTHVLKHFKKEEVTLGCYLCEFSTKERQLLTDHLSIKHEKKIQT